MGILLTGFSWWLMRHLDSWARNYGEVLHLWLLRGGILLLLVLSFQNVWLRIAEENYLFGLITPLALLGSGMVSFFLARPSGSKAFGPLLLNTLFFFLGFFWVHLGRVDEGWLAIATNLMLLITGLWLIRRGIEDAITQFFYAGIGVLLITALLRYIDLIGDYIGGALLFIVAALILFGAARYWRSQKMQKGVADV
jgi:hypothetical protein